MFNLENTRNCLLGSAVFFLGACASVNGFPERSENVETLFAQLNTEYGTSKIFDAYEDSANQAAYRNQVIAARMMAIDIRFAEFQKGMFSQRSTLLVGGDTLKSMMSAAGTLTSAGQTSQILSGLTGAFDVGTNSVDSNIYQNQTQIAVMAMMRAERAKVKSRIQERLKLSPSEYPLAMALSDLEDYYVAGSVPGALAAIMTAAGEKQAQAEAILETQVVLTDKTAQLAALRKEISPLIQKIDDSKTQKLLDDMAGNIPDSVRDNTLSFIGINSLTQSDQGVRKRIIARIIRELFVLSDEENMKKWEKEIRKLTN